MSPQSRTPAKNVEPRACEYCGETYQPYRTKQRACSRRCYDRLPDRKASSAAFCLREDVKARKNAARWVANNPERRSVNLRNNLRRYGLTLEQYEEMLAAQDGRCAVCGSQPDPNGVKASSRLHVDHDHVTGANRSLLCTRCNQGIGYFRDNPATLRAAAEYIEKHRRDVVT